MAAGFAGVALGSLAMLLVLVPSVPAAVGISCWSIAGFGIGLAYAPLSVVTLHVAPEGQEGRATSSLQLSDMLGTALGSGVGGVLVALGVAATDSDTPGLVAVYLLGAAVAVVGMVLSRRVPGRAALAAPRRRPAVDRRIGVGVAGPGRRSGDQRHGPAWETAPMKGETTR